MASDEKEPIRITVEADGMVRLQRDTEDDSGRYVDELGCYPCDDCMATQAIRQLFSRLSAAERDNERLRERPTLPWKKGPAQGEDCPIYDGDCFLVAVSVCKDSQAPEKGYVTEYEVVRVSCDEHYSAVETMRGDDWGWDWSDVEWFLPVAALTPPTEGGGV
jgi:hypothetical protein